MSLQGRSMQQVRCEVRNGRPRCALKRAKSAGTASAVCNFCNEGTAPLYWLSEPQGTHAHSLRKAASATDRGSARRQRLSTEDTSLSFERSDATGAAAHSAQLVRNSRVDTPCSASSAREARVCSSGLPKPSKASGQRTQTHCAQVRRSCAPVPKGCTQRNAQPEAAHGFRHKLLHLQTGPTGSFSGYSSPKHILKQRVRSNAVLGAPHLATRAERRGAPLDVPPVQNGCSGRIHKTYRDSPVQYVDQLDRSEASFHTLQCSTLSEVQFELRGGSVENSWMQAPRTGSSKNAEGTPAFCSLSSASNHPCILNVRRYSSGEDGGVRELKKACSYPSETCQDGAVNAVRAARICARAAVPYTGSFDRRKKVAPLWPTSAGFGDSRCSPKALLCRLTPQKTAALGSRSCARGRLISISKAPVYRVTQSHDTTGPAGGGDGESLSTLKRRGKVLRILPASPAAGSGRTERHVSTEKTRSPSFKLRGATKCLRAYRGPNSRPGASVQTERSHSLTTDISKELYVESTRSNASVVLKLHSHSEGPRTLVPRSRQQTTSSDHPDLAATSQILEHSWMFPRDEYRPPLSPQIPFNLDEDEDGTASALLVSLTEELPSMKVAVPRKDPCLEPGNQRAKHNAKCKGDEGNCGQSTAGNQAPNESIRERVESHQRAEGTEGAPSSAEGSPVAASANEPTGTTEQAQTSLGCGSKLGVSESQTSPGAAEGWAGSLVDPTRNEERTSTPRTDWCTTLSNVSLSSGATAVEIPHHVASAYKRTHGECHMGGTKDATYVGLKEFALPGDSDGGNGDQLAAPPATTSTVAGPGPSDAQSDAGEDRRELSRRAAESADGNFASAGKHCQLPFLTAAARSHEQTCKPANLAGGTSPRAVNCIQEHLRLQVEPALEQSAELPAEARRPGRSRLLAPQPLEESSGAYTFHTHKNTHYNLSEATSQQRRRLDAPRLYGYKMRRTTPSCSRAGLLDCAHDFAKLSLLQVGFATRRCSRFLERLRKQNPLKWGDGEVAYCARRESSRGRPHALENESTTSDDCSSDDSSWHASRSPSPARQVDGARCPRQVSPSPSHGTVKETVPSPRRRNRPREACLDQGRLDHSEFLHRAHVRARELDAGGKWDPRVHGRQASLRGVPSAPCVASRTFAEDLEAARRRYVQQETESAKNNTRQKEYQTSACACENVRPESNDAEEKSQRNSGGRTTWKLWGWSFSRRGHESYSRHECEGP